MKTRLRNVLQKFLDNMWVGIFLIFIPLIIKARTPDPDTFFLAATGRYIVENGTVPTINPFVLHENLGIIVQQWLFDVIVYKLYSGFGNTGLYIFLIIAFSFTIFLLYKYYGLFTTNSTLKKVTVLVTGFLYIGFLTVRPTITSFIVMLLLLYCMEKYRRTRKKGYLWVLPVLSLLEVNLHSAMWPMMFVLMVPYIFPYTLPRKGAIKENARKWFRKNCYILCSMVFMFLAGFINPNGFQGMTYVLKSYNSATDGIKIAELQSISLDGAYGLVVLFVTFVLAIFVYKNKEHLYDKEYDMQDEFKVFYMTCGVLILSCMHLRNFWYLLLGAVPTVLLVLNACRLKSNKEKKEYNTVKLIVLNISYLIGIISLFVFLQDGASYSSYTNEDSGFAPYKAVAYLDELEKEDIVLYTEFINGAFMEWNDYKVYMDARPELFQKNINGKEDIYTEYTSVYNGTSDFNAFLDKYDFTHLIVSKNTVFEMFLRYQDGYEVVVDGNEYLLYEAR